MTHNIFSPDPLFSEMMEETTKHGIKKLDLMLKFISVIEVDSDIELELNYSKLKQWLVKNIKRDLTAQEDIAIAEGLLKFIQSDEETPERIHAMKYLFNAEFLDVE